MKNIILYACCLMICLQGCNSNATDPHRVVTLNCCQMMFKNIDQRPLRIHLVSKNEPFPLQLFHTAVEDFVLNPGDYHVITTLDTLNIAYPAEPLFSTIVTPLDVSKVRSFMPIRPGMICEMTLNKAALYPGN